MGQPGLPASTRLGLLGLVAAAGARAPGAFLGLRRVRRGVGPSFFFKYPYGLCAADNKTRRDLSRRGCLKGKMILTQCAFCAADLGLSLGKKCGRCSTRYCGAACQKKHWEEGGHDTLCKKIKKGGGAEQYNANTRYTEAVVVAAEKCAEDTKGQTCYICTQALHWKTKEGLVRGCSCRGTAGFAHVSCLAEQAKILVEEAEENNLDMKVKQARWDRWHTCSLCEQEHHGVVHCALSWACWKTYLGRPEGSELRQIAMGQLGNGLYEVLEHQGRVVREEAELSLERRLVQIEENTVLALQSNIAMVYHQLGRLEEGHKHERDVYSGRLRLNGEEHLENPRCSQQLLGVAFCHSGASKKPGRLLRKTVPVARRVLGENDETGSR